MGNVLGSNHTSNAGISGNTHAERVQNYVGHNLTVNQHASPEPPSPVTSFSSKDTPILLARPSGYFQGRVKIMQDIDGILTGFQGMESYKERILVVYGIPGIGKSEVMRKFAQEYGSKYPNIAWINAESQKTIEESFKHLAAILKVDLDQNSTLEAIVTKVYKHIEIHCEPNSCLVILDNVTDLVKIRDSLPVSQSIKIPPLVVMTASEPSRNFTSLLLRELELEEALQVLRAVWGKELSEARFNEAKEPLKELATLVGFHPLALVIAASYLSEKDTRNLTKVLHIYMDRVRELSAEFAKAELRVEDATPYNNNLRALWALMTDRMMKRKSNAALKLLCILGYIDPENVDEDELRQLCDRDCPLIDQDDGWTEFFRNDENQAVYDGIKQLAQLSILMPISGYEKEEKTKHYRIHRLLQRFAREQDVKEIGLRRTFYHCIDYIPAFIYPGCLEYLDTMIKNSAQVDEKLKQMCIAVAITAKNTFLDDTLSRLMSYFETVGGSSEETQALLMMAQLYNSLSDSKSADASRTIETMSRVVNLATELPNVLRELPGQRNVKLLLGRQIQLRENETYQKRRYFLRTCRTLEKVLEEDEKIKSLEDTVKVLVCETYGKCKGNADLEDGYWHALAGCFRINACKGFLRENIQSVVHQAAQTLADGNTGKSQVPDGFLDCLLILALEPEYVSTFCSDPAFLQEMNEQTKYRVKRGFSIHRKDIYWGIFLLVACVQQPAKVEGLFTSWNFVDLPNLYKYLVVLSTEAAYFYRRWKLDRILGEFHGGSYLIKILESAASREHADGLAGNVSSQMARTFLGIIYGGSQ